MPYFTEEELENETQGRVVPAPDPRVGQLPGRKLLHVMAGYLSYQIEHHLYPDLPSNRYPEIAERVQQLCAEFGLPYTTGPLYRQYGQVLRKVLRMSLPNGVGVFALPTPPARLPVRDELPVAA